MRDRFRLRSPLAHSWPKHTPTRVCAHTPLKCIRMAFSFGLMTPSRPLLPSTTTPCCVGYVLHIHRRRCFFFFYFPRRAYRKKKQWTTCLWGLLRTHSLVIKREREREKMGVNRQYYKGLYRSIHNQWNDIWNVRFTAQSKKGNRKEPRPQFFICLSIWELEFFNLRTARSVCRENEREKKKKKEQHRS